MSSWLTTCIVLTAAYIVGALLETLTLLQFSGHLQGQRLAEYDGYAACAALALVLLARLHPQLRQWRRGLGLAAFGFSIAHTALSIEHILGGRIEGIDFLPADVRPALWMGGAALALLCPLALTSANFWVQRLGLKRWQFLHRLVYPAAALAVGHALWLGAGGWLMRLLLLLTAAMVLVVRLRPSPRDQEHAEP